MELLNGITNDIFDFLIHNLLSTAKTHRSYSGGFCVSDLNLIGNVCTIFRNALPAVVAGIA